MKKISTAQSLYLYLAGILLNFIFGILVSFVIRENVVVLLQNNFIYKIVIAIITIFVFTNLATINKYFKTMFFWKITEIITGLSFYIIYEFSLSTIIEFINILICIPVVYYFYKGFCMLSKELKNNTLYSNWKKIGIIQFVLSILSVVRFLMSLFNVNSIIILANPTLSNVLSTLLTLFVFCLQIAEIICIFKTIKVLGNTEDGSPVS